jgi:hypothetical protein
MVLSNALAYNYRIFSSSIGSIYCSNELSEPMTDETSSELSISLGPYLFGLRICRLPVSEIVTSSIGNSAEWFYERSNGCMKLDVSS